MTAKITAVLLLVAGVLFAGPVSAKTYRPWYGYQNHSYDRDVTQASARHYRSAHRYRRNARRHDARGSRQHYARASRNHHARSSRLHSRRQLARTMRGTRFRGRMARFDTGSGLSGIASIYAYRGEPTANGERANPGGLTAAHKTLPFGSRVRVTNNRNGRSVVVRINDRGPFIRGRVIDLTPAGANVLGFSGLAPVRIAVLR